MLLKTNSLRWAGLFAAALLLLVLMSFSIVYGYTDTTWKMAIDAFTNFDGYE